MNHDFIFSELWFQLKFQPTEKAKFNSNRQTTTGITTDSEQHAQPTNIQLQILNQNLLKEVAFMNKQLSLI